jgi:hypothetical protein
MPIPKITELLKKRNNNNIKLIFIKNLYIFNTAISLDNFQLYTRKENLTKLLRTQISLQGPGPQPSPLRDFSL